jgi:hypothetical protein
MVALGPGCHDEDGVDWVSYVVQYWVCAKVQDSNLVLSKVKELLSRRKFAGTGRLLRIR